MSMTGRFLLGVIMLTIPASMRAHAQYTDDGSFAAHTRPTTTAPSYPWLVDHHSAAPPRLPAVVEGSRPVEPVASKRIATRKYRWIAGHEFDWLRPLFSENVSAVIAGAGGNQALAFDHSFETTSRVWAGLENSRRNGLRARYWNIDTDAPTQVNFMLAPAEPISLRISGAGGNLSRTATTTNVGDAMTSDHHLEMTTIDLEGTHRYQTCHTDVLAFFGLRYAKAQQRAHAVVTDGGGAMTELVCQDLEFKGFGPTIGVDITRNLFAKDSMLCRLSCFANTRGSLLIGSQDQRIVLVTGGGATTVEDTHSQDDILPIGEISGGLQWIAQPFDRAIWTIRTGYRAEAWFGAGGPVTADSNLGLHGMLLSLAARW